MKRSREPWLNNGDGGACPHFFMLIYTFRLNFTAEQILTIYRGDAQRISVLSEQGLRIELAAQHLRRFIGHSGLQGRFRLRTDDNHRFLDLERIG